MDIGEPGRALVVEIGQGALLQVAGAEGGVVVCVDGVEPALAELVEALPDGQNCFQAPRRRNHEGSSISLCWDLL